MIQNNRDFGPLRRGQITYLTYLSHERRICGREVGQRDILQCDLVGECLVWMRIEFCEGGLRQFDVGIVDGGRAESIAVNIRSAMAQRCDALCNFLWIYHAFDGKHFDQ